jgi:hypothetical protein
LLYLAQEEFKEGKKPIPTISNNAEKALVLMQRKLWFLVLRHSAKEPIQQ